MLFRLSERGIATVTFTNAEPLTELMRAPLDDGPTAA